MTCKYGNNKQVCKYGNKLSGWKALSMSITDAPGCTINGSVNGLSSKTLTLATFDDDDPEANNNLHNERFKQGRIHVAY